MARLDIKLLMAVGVGGWGSENEEDVGEITFLKM